MKWDLIGLVMGLIWVITVRFGYKTEPFVGRKRVGTDSGFSDSGSTGVAWRDVVRQGEKTGRSIV